VLNIDASCRIHEIQYGIYSEYLLVPSMKPWMRDLLVVPMSIRVVCRVFGDVLSGRGDKGQEKRTSVWKSLGKVCRRF
jgi:hypothetical protein